jgi:hypothetical protein
MSFVAFKFFLFPSSLPDSLALKIVALKTITDRTMAIAMKTSSLPTTGRDRMVLEFLKKPLLPENCYYLTWLAAPWKSPVNWDDFCLS